MFSTVLQNLPLLFHGVLTTAMLVVCALVVGFLLASALTLLMNARIRPLTWLIEAWIFMIRGTPLLLQIFLIYYGSAQFVWLRDSALWVLFKEPFFCAVLALALNTSAYTTEIFSGAMAGIPFGEVEACYAYGMTRWQALTRIIFPRALRAVIPAYSNEVIMVLKASSLASTITLLDLMGVTRQIIAATYQTIPFYLLAGALYLALNGLVMISFRLLERRFLAFAHN